MNESEINAMMALSDNDFLEWLPDPMETTPEESLIIADEVERRFPGARAEFYRRMAARIDDFVKSQVCERHHWFDLTPLISDSAPKRYYMIKNGTPPEQMPKPPKPPLRPAMAADDVVMGVQYDRVMAGS